MNASELKEQTHVVLQRNNRGDFTMPSPHQYPHQWNWDAALIALGWSHFDLPRARAEIQSLLRAQWRDGMVPHIIYHQGASDYFPQPEFWQTRELAHGGAIESSALTQPPILATVVRMLHTRSDDVDEAHGFLREVFPKILAWHRWLHHARDADGTGLPCLIHPWESGTDNSPRWAPALDRIIPRDLPAFRRRDTQHVSLDERPVAEDYERFVYLIDLGRRMGWEPTQLLDAFPFLVQDVMFCSILHRADQDLLALAQLLEEPTLEIVGWIEKTRQVFDGRFWNEARGLYLDYDVRAGAPIFVNTCATFMPLFAGLASRDQAARLMNEHWNNAAEYAPTTLSAADSKFRLPTTSKAEPGYAPRRYWCGPVWIIINWLAYQGLQRYALHEQADSIRADSLALLETQGFREYYDPRDGSGSGATDFSWSAALALEFLEEGSANL
jgi:glycogen debranching enzyme